MVKIANVGCKATITTLLSNVDFVYVEDTGRDWSEERRHFPALEGLKRLCKVGDTAVIDTLLDMIKKSHLSNRVHCRALLATLSECANTGNRKVITALFELMPGFHSTAGVDYYRDVIGAAISALEKVVHVSDRKLLPEMVCMLADPHTW